MRYSVPKAWAGDTCVILAGGPSLKSQSLDQFYRPDGGRTPGIRVITINDSWRLAPYADVFYFCDPQWWTTQIARNLRSVNNLVSFHDAIYKGFWITSAPGFDSHPQVHALRLTGQRGIELNRSALRHGDNSGYQTINLAVHFGVAKIILLGYDMRIVSGQTHWHTNTEQTPEGFNTVLSKAMLPHFGSLVEPLFTLGVSVINATPGSALTCFPQRSLTDALDEII